MGLLDANVAQLVSSSSSFNDQASLMRGTIQQGLAEEITGAISETASGSANGSLTAGFKRSW